MTVILIVEKNGNIKETKVKNIQVSELYKKAGFKSEEGFLEPVVSWPRPGVDPFTLDYQIQVFGKTKGRAGQENKYDFPPPIDNTLFFGNVAMIAVRPDGGVVDLTMSAWEMVYEQLFGGFEDLVDSKGRSLDEEISEDEELEGVEFTKEGYVKDDFIVDDEEVVEEEEVVEDEDKVFRKNMIRDSDDEFELPKKSRKDKKKTVVVEEKPEKKSKKTKKSTKLVLETEEIPQEILIAPPAFEEEEELENNEEYKLKKQRKPRVIKTPKEPKVKKVKEPKEPKETKEKSEPKKKTKRSGKKNLEEMNSETIYVPMDTEELEEENYV